MSLTEVVKQAISQAESELTERELRDHKRLRTAVIDILKWMQCRKIGFLVHKPNYISEEYLPIELIEYLGSNYCQESEILIPYEWEVDCDKWKATGENRNFWHICKTSIKGQKPMKKSSPSYELGSPNTWERGRD